MLKPCHYSYLATIASQNNSKDTIYVNVLAKALFIRSTTGRGSRSLWSNPLPVMTLSIGSNLTSSARHVRALELVWPCVCVIGYSAKLLRR